MIAVLSPSKTLRELNFSIEPTEPHFDKDAKKLNKVLQKYDVSELMKLMDISEKLAILNHDRYKHFQKAPAFPAGWLFHGDVFNGLAIDDFTKEDITYSNQHIRVLSGMYGVLRLTDSIKPYRLEMGTKLHTTKGKTLYDYWGDRVTKEILKHPEADILVNLASKEYAKVLNLKTLRIPVLEIEFMEIRKGKPVGIPLFSKKARGLMARFMVKTKAVHAKDLKAFDYDGYSFAKELSHDYKYVFTR